MLTGIRRIADCTGEGVFAISSGIDAKSSGTGCFRTRLASQSSLCPCSTSINKAVLITRKPLDVSIARIDSQGGHGIGSSSVQPDTCISGNVICGKLDIGAMGTRIMLIGTIQADGAGKIAVTFQNKPGSSIVSCPGLPADIAGTFQRIDIPDSAPAFLPKGQITAIDNETLKISPHGIGTASGVESDITIDNQIAADGYITFSIEIEMASVHYHGTAAHADILATQGDSGRIGKTQIPTLR